MDALCSLQLSRPGNYSHGTNDDAFAAAIAPDLATEFAVIPKYGIMHYDGTAKQWILDKDGSQKKLDAGIKVHLKRLFREWTPKMAGETFAPNIVRHKAIFGQPGFINRAWASVCVCVCVCARNAFARVVRLATRHCDLLSLSALCEALRLRGTQGQVRAAARGADQEPPGL